jgi:hypothetical protein
MKLKKEDGKANCILVRDGVELKFSTPIEDDIIESGFLYQGSIGAALHK